MQLPPRLELGEDGLHLVFDLHGEVDEWSAEALRDGLEHPGARVLGAVDGVAEAHDAAAREDLLADPAVDAVRGADGDGPDPVGFRFRTGEHVQVVGHVGQILAGLDGFETLTETMEGGQDRGYGGAGGQRVLAAAVGAEIADRAEPGGGPEQ